MKIKDTVTSKSRIVDPRIFHNEERTAVTISIQRGRMLKGAVELIVPAVRAKAYWLGRKVSLDMRLL